LKNTKELSIKQLTAKIAKLLRATHYYLAPLYARNNAWALTAWEMDKLAGEELDKDYKTTIDYLRKNLYAYIASLGAEWPAEEENNILLPGTYVEAAKALKALWLSLHLVYLAPTEQPAVIPPPQELYQLYRRYLVLRRMTIALKPIPFKVADQFLEAAAYVALLAGRVEPTHFEILGLAEIVADIVWLLSKTIKPP